MAIMIILQDEHGNQIEKTELTTEANQGIFPCSGTHRKSA
jgi:hypothetical protein